MQTPSIDWATLAAIAECVSAIGIFFAFLQIVSSNKQHKENSRRASAAEAISIARKFQNTIIPDFTLVSRVLHLTGHKAYFGDNPKLVSSELRFTKEEAIEIFGDTFEQTSDEYDKRITPTLLGTAAAMSRQVIVTPVKSTKSDVDLSGEIERNINQINAFNSVRMALLNTMEWIAMTLNTKVADELVIYQSLHQIFLRYIRLEYPLIASSNCDTNACDQYYTNIITLYKLWASRSLESHHKDQELVKKEEELVRRKKAQLSKQRNGNIRHAPEVTSR